MVTTAQLHHQTQPRALAAGSAAGGGPAPISLAVWNVERGGRDPDGGLHRRPGVLECAAELAGTNIVVVCEANSWHHRWTDTGFAAAVGAMLGAHSYFVAPHDPFRTPDEARCHKMVFLAGEVAMVEGSWIANVDWLANTPDQVHIGNGTLRAEGWPAIDLGIVHLSPWGGWLRLAQANRLTALTNRGLRLLLGDFNCSGPGDIEPDWDAARARGITDEQINWHKTPDSSYDHPRLDRRALQKMTELGWVDLAEHYDANHPTPEGQRAVDQPTSGFWPPPQTPLETRKLHALANPRLVQQITVTDYQVYTGPAWLHVSDHGAFRAVLTLTP